MAYDYEKLKRQLSGLTYNQLGKMLSTGKIDEGGLRYYYSRARKTALTRVKAASGTDVAFTRNPPHFRTIRQTVTTSDLVREIADVNRFLGGATTVTQRRAKRDETIQTLHERGFDFVTRENFNRWAAFMDWGRSAGIFSSADGYDSESAEVEETFRAAERIGARDLETYKQLFEAVTGRVL